MASSLGSYKGASLTGQTIVGGDGELTEWGLYMARKPDSLLLTGETGTGKSRLAELLHLRSGRPSNRWVHINIAEYSEGMIASALFGNIRGAYTGAVKDRDGAFVRANGGTLFIDEIGELSHALQAKLLRVMDTGLVQAIGSDVFTQVDVRIIMATHSPHKLRQDLKARMRKRHTMPALRDSSSLEFERMVGRLVDVDTIVDAGAMKELRAYDWPDNVRGLASVLREAEHFAAFSAGVRRSGAALHVNMVHVCAVIHDHLAAREEDARLEARDAEAPPPTTVINNITQVIPIYLSDLATLTLTAAEDLRDEDEIIQHADLVNQMRRMSGAARSEIREAIAELVRLKILEAVEGATWRSYRVTEKAASAVPRPPP